jgi:hypothetical protein
LNTRIATAPIKHGASHINAIKELIKKEGPARRGDRVLDGDGVTVIYTVLAVEVTLVDAEATHTMPMPWMSCWIPTGGYLHPSPAADASGLDQQRHAI